RHHHVGDHQVALAARHPAPQGGGIGGHPHLVADARQRLVEHRADGRVVVRHQNVAAHAHRTSSPGFSSLPASPFHAGIRTRKVVPRGEVSHSITPPCSPTILATSA